jgi:hypothetical protein
MSRCTALERRTPRGGGRTAHTRVVVMVVVALASGATLVRAQAVGRWDISAGIRLLGAVGLGRVDALQTGNGRTPLALFTTESEQTRSAGWQVIAGRQIADDLQVEAAFSVHPTLLATRIAGDVEGAAGTRATEPNTLLQVEGGVRWTPSRLTLTRRTQLFASAGGGYLRQLHAGRTLVETGRSVYVGGGVLRSMWQGANGTAVGVRLDGRVVGLLGGVAFDRKLRATPALTVAAQLRF